MINSYLSMIIYKNMNLFNITSYLLISLSCFSQKAENVHIQQQSKNVIVTYDIIEKKCKYEYNVELYYSSNDSNWTQALKGLSGNIGKNIPGGSGKKIIWDVSKDACKVADTSFEYKVDLKLADTDIYYTDERDCKKYRIVKIGSQTWMAENLNFTLPNSNTSGCYNNSEDSCKKYGRLYNWYTAQHICPAGSHLPLKEEFDTLLNYVGGAGNNAYNSLIKSDTLGFNIFYSGWRDGRDYRFKDFGSMGGFWASEMDFYTGWTLYINNHEIYSNGGSKKDGFSVRCILNK